MDILRNGQPWKFDNRDFRILRFLPTQSTISVKETSDPTRALVELMVDVDEDKFRKRFNRDADIGGDLGWLVDQIKLDLTDEDAVRSWVNDMTDLGALPG